MLVERDPEESGGCKGLGNELGGRVFSQHAPGSGLDPLPSNIHLLSSFQLVPPEERNLLNKKDFFTKPQKSWDQQE